ncbi:MAG: short-chain dehydrogenase [bacterium TMED161]|nr:MAG: short-chain dehydrogenase [bacterium TMED161]|tara:strand:+ start:10395 stop:11171 length:777 start_codon:yes stop_codon:yes gene_type:complete
MNNKHALVCGSSKGIGASTAIELSKLGATITLLARDKDSLTNVLDCLDTSKKQNHNFIIADFDDPLKLKNTIDQHVANNPTIHILINNSGGPKPGPIVDANVEDFISAFNRHLICNHILVQAVVPKMKEARFGRIINITSTSVKQPIKGLGISNTIRGAVANWAKTLSFELGEFGITVNNILPGYTDTQRLKEIFLNKSKKSKYDIESIVSDAHSQIPLGRFADPKETAKAICFLASEDASYINGINLPVDGGRLSTL